MKWFGCLLVPFLATIVFSASLNSNDPQIVGGKKRPPVVSGVGSENLEPKYKQMTRKLVNEAKDEDRPYLEAERSLQVKRDGWSPYGKGTEWCTSDGRELLEWFTDITRQRCQGLCVQQKGRKCKAVEYWSGKIHACFQCTDLSKVESYTDSNDWGYPVHVWVRD